jgi:4-amino-4-deoxy-L-arabinose transferase-like glycosyltransferase
VTLGRILRWALLIRVAAAVILHVFVDESVFAPDQETYHFYGAWLARYWSGDTLVFPPKLLADHPKVYYYIVGALYWLFGPYSLVPKLVNALVGTATVKLAYDIAWHVSSNATVARRAAILTAFFPSLVLWSVLNIRDCWVVLLILVMCRAGLAVRERIHLRGLIVLVGSMILISGFRDYLFFALAAPVVLSFLVGRSGNPLRNAALGIVVASGLIYFDRVSGTNHARFVDLESIQETRHFTNYGESRFAESVDISTPGKALVFLPRGVAFFLLAPYPWQISSFRQAVTLPEMLFFYTLLPAIIVGFRYLFTQNTAHALLVCLVAACLTLGYALGEANAGGAYRHRAQVIVLLLVFASVGREVSRKRREMRALTADLAARRI